MKLVKFNTNEYVRVRLTAEGRRILRANGGCVDRYKPDEYGYIRMQAWHWMETFGPHTHLGAKTPTETEVYFEVEE